MKLLFSLLSFLFIVSTHAQTWQDVGGGLGNSSYALLEYEGGLVS